MWAHCYMYVCFCVIVNELGYPVGGGYCNLGHPSRYTRYRTEFTSATPDTVEETRKLLYDPDQFLLHWYSLNCSYCIYVRSIHCSRNSDINGCEFIFTNYITTNRQRDSWTERQLWFIISGHTSYYITSHHTSSTLSTLNLQPNCVIYLWSTSSTSWTVYLWEQSNNYSSDWMT